MEKTAKKEEKEAEWRILDVKERLAYALVKVMNLYFVDVLLMTSFML